jgi:hypothetical protein
MRIVYLKYSFISLITLFFVFSACKSKAETKTSVQTETTCKILINFASRGTGIDNTKYDALMSLLNSRKLKFTEKVKGREGEKEICVPLSELNGKEKTDFIEQLKKLEDKNTLVSVSVI